MKIGILHHDLEEQEEVLGELLSSRDFEVSFYDVRDSSLENLFSSDVVLNRVFASVANRNYEDNLLTLNVLEKLEAKKVRCINSHFTTKCDYSKYFSFLKMKDAGVLTPETFLIKNLDELDEAVSFSRKVGFDSGMPVVLKRDIGGRGKDIHLVKTEEELIGLLKKSIGEVQEDGYKGGYIVQEFVKSILDYDYRVSMVDGEIVYSMTRSFVSDDSGEKWIASMSLGSKENKVELPVEIERISLRATESIGGFFNDADIMVGEKGAYIIENNPTPNFAKRADGNDNGKMELVISKLVDRLVTI